jgi:hypothetical protein
VQIRSDGMGQDGWGELGRLGVVDGVEVGLSRCKMQVRWRCACGGGGANGWIEGRWREACVRACVCACVRACVRAMRACIWVGVAEMKRKRCGSRRVVVDVWLLPSRSPWRLLAWLLLAGFPAGLLALAASSVAGVVGCVDESTGPRRSVLGAWGLG